ncbi:hypothetical protein [Streptomyces sp. NPDC018031]|uniref:hypothetical protein n=1 Tax=Streptomyces sp. NPDC018031 TaxID=3365033 RepID=UPI00379417C4
MPTPHGPRGGMAFSADELRVLRRALAIALQPTTVPALPGSDRAEEVRDCLRLAEAVDAAVHEGGRLRAFLFDELARYRDALPGAALGYLDRLRGALSAGYLPRPEDLAALRRLSAAPVGATEAARRRALLGRCERLAEQHVRARLARRTGAVDGVRPVPPLPWSRPAVRTAARRLRALPGGLTDRADGPGGRPADAAPPPGGPGRPLFRAARPVLPAARPGDPCHRPGDPRPCPGDRVPRPGGAAPVPGRCATGKPAAPQGTPKPAPRKKPAAPDRGGPGRGAPSPGRPVPTPAEVFPPKRRPAPPAEGLALAAAVRTA